MAAEEDKKKQEEAQKKEAPQLGSDEGDKVSESHPGWGSVSATDIADAVGIRELNGIMGNSAQMRTRQRMLDPTKYKTEYKAPNPGKMPHNQDPYPVDLKIEELEAHYPPTRIYELTTHVHGQPAAQAAMNVGFNAEKRLVKLENMLATIHRYLFRLGARVQINCVYYGGQTAGEMQKYNCIRCLHDDRVTDGQLVSIDQCLCCTRFEPIYGNFIIKPNNGQIYGNNAYKRKRRFLYATRKCYRKAC